MKILVADDHSAFVAAQADLLQRHGHSVLTSTEGADVMALVEEARPDVLLLDLAMPGMNGFDVAEELHENPDLRPKLLIAVTGDGVDGTREMTAKAGFDHHLVKPVALRKLLTILSTVSSLVRSPC